MFYKINQIEIKPSIKSDHSLLQMKINLLNEQKRGPGFWKFNCSLLKDEVYIKEIKEYIDKLKQQYSYVKHHGIRWDLIKCEMRQFTINYSKKQSRARKELENKLYKQYEEAVKLYEKVNSKKNLESVENIKAEIEEINSIKTAGAHIRSKAFHIEGNEKCTSYFLNVEKRNYKMKHIQKLNVSETEIVTEPKTILNEEKSFYQKLYKKDNKVT